MTITIFHRQKDVFWLVSCIVNIKINKGEDINKVTVDLQQSSQQVCLLLATTAVNEQCDSQQVMTAPDAELALGVEVTGRHFDARVL